MVRNAEDTKLTKLKILSLGKHRNVNTQKCTYILENGGEDCLFYIHCVCFFIAYSYTNTYDSLFLSVIYQSLWSIIKDPAVLSIVNGCLCRTSSHAQGLVFHSYKLYSFMGNVLTSRSHFLVRSGWRKELKHFHPDVPDLLYNRLHSQNAKPNFRHLFQVTKFGLSTQIVLIREQQFGSTEVRSCYE